MTPNSSSVAGAHEAPSRARRGRDVGEAHRVSTPLELLFDLVFVVAIALSAQQLHHGVMEHHTGMALASFLAAFVAIWWAWMNYTWFASAYDDDSPLFRLLTLVQMGGALLFATGIDGLFRGDFKVSVTGYAVMRMALVVQWLLAARGDSAHRPACLRYALGVTLVQVLWIARLVMPVSWAWPTFIAFMALELAVPVWAERPGMTPWHPHHIAERYGLLVIITLGECVLGATNSVAGIYQSQGWSLELALVGLGATSLVFSLWWMYFLQPMGDALHHHRDRAFLWGYGHFVVFASAAAVGASLEVVADVLKAEGAAGAAAEVAHGVSPLYAITLLAAAVAAFIASFAFIYARTTRPQDPVLGWTLLCLACVALGPLAVWLLGVPLAWAMLLLPLGPTVAIVHHERGRRLHAERFALH